MQTRTVGLQFRGTVIEVYSKAMQMLQGFLEPPRHSNMSIKTASRPLHQILWT